MGIDGGHGGGRSRGRLRPSDGISKGTRNFTFAVQLEGIGERVVPCSMNRGSMVNEAREMWRRYNASGRRAHGGNRGGGHQGKDELFHTTKFRTDVVSA